jgi:hypothetical protein
MADRNTSDLITMQAIKAEFGLTDALIRDLGDPDDSVPNPHGRNAADIQLFSRARVTQYVQDHPDQIAKAARRRAAAKRGAATRRVQARAMVDHALATLELEPAPPRGQLLDEVRAFLFEYDPDFDGYVSRKAVLSYLRHNYTNYEEILEKLQGKVGARNLYQHVKDCLNKRIEEEYRAVLRRSRSEAGRATR